MQCLALSSPLGAKEWTVYRSIEVISYHREDETVKILIGLFLENRKDDGPNTLHVLHRGAAHLELRQAWPLPSHPDERAFQECNLSTRIYGRAFEVDSKNPQNVCHVSSLTPWDTWEKLSRPEEVHFFAENDVLKGNARQFLAPIWPIEHSAEWYPFTIWELKPFPHMGFYLVSFVLTLSGETYRRLVESEATFSVDGPKRLLRRIASFDLAELDHRERTNWTERLQPFEDLEQALYSRAYDVILLGEKYADGVILAPEMCINGITEGACKAPPTDEAMRFITTSQYFTLPLRFPPSKTGQAMSGNIAEAVR